MGFSPGDGQDLTQEAFVTFLETIERFEGRSEIGTWLFGILRHNAQERRRAHAREELPDALDEAFECASRPTGRGKNHGFRQTGSWRLGKWPMRFANAWLDFPCSIVTSSSWQIEDLSAAEVSELLGSTINHVASCFTVHASDYARV